MTPPPSRRTLLALALGAAGVVLVGILVVVFALGALGPQATPAPTTTATDRPTTLPSADASAQPTAPSPQPSPATSPPASLPPATPSSAVDALLLHVPEALRATCTPATFLEPALAAVSCTADGGAISVAYTHYPDQPSMAATYEAGVLAAGIEDDSGRCYNQRDDGTLTATHSRWPSENGYTLNDEPAGRYLCHDAGDPGVPTITWTDDRLYILGVVTSTGGDVDRLIGFWVNEAGPVQ